MSEPAAKPRPMIDLDEFERRLRRPAAAPQSQEDPLAELARLVGGHEDPFKSVFEQDGRLARLQQRAAPASFAPPPPAPVENYAAEDYPEEQPEFHGTIHPQTYAPEEPAVTPAHQMTYYSAPAEQQAAQEQGYEWPQTANERVFVPEARRSRRPLFAAAAIFAVGVLGIGASFAYKSKSTPREIATIQAMSGPTKVQPESPGGMDVPNQDASILDKGPQQTPTKLANHEERPVDLSLQQAAPQPSKAVMAADTGAMTASTGAASAPMPPSGSQQTTPQVSATQPDIQSYGIGALIEPKKVKTISVGADGKVLPNDTPPQIPATIPAPQHMAAPAPTAPPKPAATPKSTARVVTTPKPAQTMDQLADAGNNDAPAPVAAPPAAVAPAPVKPKPAPAKPMKVAATEATDSAQDAPKSNAGSTGDFAVQFAAPGSEQEAHELTAKLATKFGGDLSGHHLTYHRAKVGDKTVFRVRASGMSREEATGICQKVQSSGGSCFVAKS